MSVENAQQSSMSDKQLEALIVLTTLQLSWCFFMIQQSGTSHLFSHEVKSVIKIFVQPKVANFVVPFYSVSYHQSCLERVFIAKEQYTLAGKIEKITLAN